MSDKRKGLGRGLGALIPTGPRGASPVDHVIGGLTPPTQGGAGAGTPVAPGPDQVDLTVAPYAELPLDAVVPNPRQPRRRLPGVRAGGWRAPLASRAAGRVHRDPRHRP